MMGEKKHIITSMHAVAKLKVSPPSWYDIPDKNVPTNLPVALAI